MLNVLENIKKIHSRLFIILFLISCVSLYTLYPQTSYAADPCTTDNNGIDNPEYTQTATNLVSSIVEDIRDRVSNVTTSMYLRITSDFNFIVSIYAILTLYIIVYAISFMTGMIQIKLYDLIIRMIKIGIIVSLIGPASWFYFSDYLVGFFDRGVDEIIAYTTSSGLLLGSNAVGPYTSTFNDTETAFRNIDNIVGKIFSAKTFVTLLALFMAKPYGTFYFVLMMIALWSFMKSLMTAMWVYVISLIIRAILLGLAPVFIPTIMFQRTRHIFDGWLNQLVSVSLQPIMLFVFFVFFVKMMEGAMDNILANPVCFSKYPEGWRGSAFDFSFWKFAVRDPVSGWVPNTKEWGTADTYPIDEMAIYTFLLIAEIGNRFNAVVVQIAAQIAQTSTRLIGANGTFSQIKSAMFSGNAARHRAPISKYKK